MSGFERGLGAISGSLEDVVVSDVLQFIQLGKRTGTLVLRRYAEAAAVGFHRGRMIAAAAPRTPRVRHLLVTTGLVDRHTIESLVSSGVKAGDHRSLVAALLERGLIDENAVRDLVANQLEQAVSEILRWETGTFDFVVDDLSSIDDVVLLPDEEREGEENDVRSVIIEATRIFDARSRRTPSGSHRAASAAPPYPGSAAGVDLGLSAEEISEAVEPLERGRPQPAADLLELQVVTEDEVFVAALQPALEGELARVHRVTVNRAGEAAIGAPPPIVLIDLRRGGSRPEVLGAVRTARPLASVLALVDPGSDFSRAYAAGALAAVPAQVGAVVACVESIIENRRDLVRGRQSNVNDPGVARLRRMMDDLRSGVMSASMALNLMHVISESVERAVLFLVKQDELAVLGAFGHDVNGHLLAAATKGLRLQLEDDNVLTDSVRSGSVASTAVEDARLPEALESVLGRPASGQVVVFPVQGAQRVIAVVYADNGDRPDQVEDIEILELATAQVGIAFENELLRRQLASRKSP